MSWPLLALRNQINRNPVFEAVCAAKLCSRCLKIKSTASAASPMTKVQQNSRTAVQHGRRAGAGSPAFQKLC